MAASVELSLQLVDRAENRILAKAFSGQLIEHDPADEPASQLLERIRKMPIVPPAVAPKPPKAKPVKTDPKQALLVDSAEWPEKGLPFETIAERVVLPYSAVRDALFYLLGGPSPSLEQVFDKQEGRMLLRRAAP